MVILNDQPILSLIVFSVIPLIGGLIGYFNASGGNISKFKKAMIGASIGLLIALLLLSIVLSLFVTQ